MKALTRWFENHRHILAPSFVSQQIRRASNMIERGAAASASTQANLEEVRERRFNATQGTHASPHLEFAMTETLTPKTHRASFALRDEATAKRVSDLLTESLFEGEAAVAAFEGASGRWDITLLFAQAP